MGQTFHWIEPVECSPGSTGTWIDVDLDSYVGGLGADVTGVLLYLWNSNGGGTLWNFGVRKNGSTDNRHDDIDRNRQCYAAVGVDANHIFECYIESTSYCEVYIVGYTTTGVSFFTNAYDKSLGTTGAWTDIDCSSECPDAVGLIFEQKGSGTYCNGGMRKNGSTDNRISRIKDHRCFGVIIGCDASQVCEAKIANTALDHFLHGYITDGATFITNATDYSIATTSAWTDMNALPGGAVGGFFESYPTDNGGHVTSIRKNGSSDDISGRTCDSHVWHLIESASLICECWIDNTVNDVFLSGYATAAAAAATHSFGFIMG